MSPLQGGGAGPTSGEWVKLSDLPPKNGAGKRHVHVLKVPVPVMSCAQRVPLVCVMSQSNHEKTDKSSLGDISTGSLASAPSRRPAHEKQAEKLSHTSETRN